MYNGQIANLRLYRAFAGSGCFTAVAAVCDRLEEEEDVALKNGHGHVTLISAYKTPSILLQ